MLGLAAAALGLPAGLSDGAWVTTAGGLLLAISTLPRFWGGLGRWNERPSAPMVQLVLWNVAMAGVIALTLLAFAGTSDNLARVGLALYVVAALVLLITVDSAEVRLRRSSASTGS